jgi:hypothetical protein
VWESKPHTPLLELIIGGGLKRGRKRMGKTKKERFAELFGFVPDPDAEEYIKWADRRVCSAVARQLLPEELRDEAIALLKEFDRYSE